MIKAFHLGTDLFVESNNFPFESSLTNPSLVDIALPGQMQLHEAHDIGTDLQMKLEDLPEIERAFVHIDYEHAHKTKEKLDI